MLNGGEAVRLMMGQSGKAVRLAQIDDRLRGAWLIRCAAAGNHVVGACAVAAAAVRVVVVVVVGGGELMSGRVLLRVLVLVVEAVLLEALEPQVELDLIAALEVAHERRRLGARVDEYATRARYVGHDGQVGVDRAVHLILCHLIRDSRSQPQK